MVGFIGLLGTVITILCSPRENFLAPVGLVQHETNPQLDPPQGSLVRTISGTPRRSDAAFINLHSHSPPLRSRPMNASRTSFFRPYVELLEKRELLRFHIGHAVGHFVQSVAHTA